MVAARIPAGLTQLSLGFLRCTVDVPVDCARAVDGVLGAGLVGAGLGGCVSVLVRADRVDELTETLRAGYFAPRRVEPFIEVCAPVAGASVASA